MRNFVPSVLPLGSALAGGAPSSVLLLSPLLLVLLLFVGVELCFYWFFHLVLVPRSNLLTEPQPYRDYGRDRRKLLLRILQRLEAQGDAPLPEVVRTFLLQWFRAVPKNARPDGEEPQRSAPMRETSFSSVGTTSTACCPNSSSESDTSSLSSATSDTDRVRSDDSPSSGDYSDLGCDATVEEGKDNSLPKAPCCTIDGIGKYDVDDLFAWAFFGKDPEQLVRWERHELEAMHRIVQEHVRLEFDAGGAQSSSLLSGSKTSSCYRARKMTLEPVNALHRPLAVYLAIMGLRWLVGLFLRCLGFRRLVASTGLVGWYRPRRSHAGAAGLMPLLFFHGIAPGGHVFYLPMLLCGLAGDGRPLFVFENPSISCVLGFAALDERQTTQGVREIVQEALGDGSDDASEGGLALVGHSFGSVPLTWLIHDPYFQPRIRHMILLDPVTILLSEPDVVINFLYTQEVSKIRLLASSELFVEQYLRRHFSWYNAELWLDDVPSHTAVTVALAGRDEIISAAKVRRELDRHSNGGGGGNNSVVSSLYWEEATHAHCVTSPSKWQQIRELMLRQQSWEGTATTRTSKMKCS